MIISSGTADHDFASFVPPRHEPAAVAQSIEIKRQSGISPMTLGGTPTDRIAYK
ncbi:hypothetical protein [Bradyrhizobium sp. WD16]|uniref:hypothetical protein n=1 Tax=Bradyrhizobium sp. WD16 TaxID=1521768 RepID=UPI0020A5C6AB|nr:hypothetical protein [Bradyrhizobium sp. WD16]